MFSLPTIPISYVLSANSYRYRTLPMTCPPTVPISHTPWQWLLCPPFRLCILPTPSLPIVPMQHHNFFQDASCPETVCNMAPCIPISYDLSAHYSDLLDTLPIKFALPTIPISYPANDLSDYRHIISLPYIVIIYLYHIVIIHRYHISLSLSHHTLPMTSCPGTVGNFALCMP